MSTKIQITIPPDTEYLAHDEIDLAMQRTLKLLAGEAGVPTRKLTLTIECKDEDAELHEDTIDAALSGRPVGIEVTLKTTKERHVARITSDVSRPMDAIEGFAARHGVERVELRSAGQAVTLTSQTARNAAAMLHDAPVGSDGPPRR